MLLALCVLLTSTSGWSEVSRTPDLVVYRRERAGSDLFEVMAVGTFDASPERVHRVLDDGDRYKEIMPSTKESRVLKRDVDAGGRALIWSYERIAPPLIAERDYTVKVTHEERGHVVVHRFAQSNADGPAPKDGVVRVELLEGSWELEAVGRAGSRTRATYRAYTSTGGDVPTFIINIANTAAVPEIFAAIKRALPDKRYDAAASSDVVTNAVGAPSRAAPSEAGTLPHSAKTAQSEAGTPPPSAETAQSEAGTPPAPAQ